MSDKLLLANYGFNPRICKRCDIGLNHVLKAASGVSIHASVKDATFSIFLYILYI